MKILIPMAGAGSRFIDAGYEKPKPLIDVGGKPMIQRVVETLGLDGDYSFIVRNYEEDKFNEELRYTLLNLKGIGQCQIHTLDHLTGGAADTCLTVEKLIDNDDPLIIINCDQVFNWDPEKFVQFVNSSDADGIVATFNSDDPKNSYIRLDENGKGIELAEKQVISDMALTGLHYWTKGRYFVSSAKQMIQNNDRSNNEFYIAPTYNYLISDKKHISSFHMRKDQTLLIGTPEDLNIFIKMLDAGEL